MKISSISNANNKEWDETWAACPYATYFHSGEWAEIWAQYTAGQFEQLKAAAQLISFTDGKKALLPLSYYASYRGLIKKYVSSPGGTFGGWLSSDELTSEHARLLSEHILQNLPALEWRINPYDPLKYIPESSCMQQETTSTLSLEDDFEKIFRSWSKGHIAAVAQARKNGITIGQASDREAWRRYFNAYEQSIERWGKDKSSGYRWELFNLIYEKRSPHVRLWTASKEDKIIAGALCFYAKKHVVYWHGAALQDYFKMRPVNLLLYEAIKDAKQQGYAWFDFNPSGKLEGVRAFKKSFGTEEFSCPLIKSYKYSLKNKLIIAGFRTFDKLKRMIR